MDKSIAMNEMAEAFELLSSYEKKSGLPDLSPPGTEEELEQYLTMNRNMMEKLTADECGNIAYRLAQFSFYTQRLLNREKARISWASVKLNDTTSSLLQQYDKYMRYEVKVALIVKENNYAETIYKIRNHAQERVDRLDGLADHIKHLSNIMKSNIYTRNNYDKD